MKCHSIRKLLTVCHNYKQSTEVHGWHWIHVSPVTLHLLVNQTKLSRWREPELSNVMVETEKLWSWGCEHIQLTFKILLKVKV